MIRSLLIITFICVSVASFAKENDINSEVKPKQTVKIDRKSFTVHGLHACSGEYADTDATGTFLDKPTKETSNEFASKAKKEAK